MATREYRGISGIVEGVLAHPLQFLFFFFLTFFITLSMLTAIGFVPDSFMATEEEPILNEESQTIREEEQVPTSAYVEPEFIEIEAIGVSSAVVNPSSTDIAELDAALKSGAVRYPGSGTLEEERPMFLFGHSSYLPVVHNQAYRAFNRLGNLKNGDSIVVRGGGREYFYRVTSVRLDKATEIRVDLVGPKKLVLATCDSFGKVDDRFVVEAEYLGSQPI